MARKTLFTQRGLLNHYFAGNNTSRCLETQHIHCVAGLADGHTALLAKRLCRPPYQTISDVGLIGGGTFS
jgi:hypothetical protein